LLGDRREYPDYRIAKDAGRVEILFGETAPRNAVARQSLEMLQGFEYAFTAQPIE
jgi:hypothetical protein